MRYNEISHFSHPQHKLKFEYTEALFKCDGCNEVGIGSRYKCATCDYDLHLQCALPSPSFTHPFYTKCSFQFHPRPPGTVARYCNACEKDVTGFMYHCKSCGFDLHPCCAKLPVVLDDGDVKLYLYRKVSASCHRCGRKGRSWSYRSSCKKYNLHVACVKEMLVESWHDHQINSTMSNNSHFGRGGVNNNFNGGGKLETRIPKGTLQSYQKRSGNKGKIKKCSEMAGLAIQFVVSAVLGDPTTLIAGIPEIIFWHIPSTAYKEVAPKSLPQSSCAGSINLESVAAQEAEIEAMKLLEDRPSVKAVFVGHIHGLDRCCPYKKL